MATYTQPNPAFRLTTLVQRYPLTFFFAVSIGIDWLLSLVARWDATLFLSIALAMLFHQTQGSVLFATILHAATDTMFILVSPLVETNVMITAWVLVAIPTALVAVALVLITGVNLGQKQAYA